MPENRPRTPHPGAPRSHDAPAPDGLARSAEGLDADAAAVRRMADPAYRVEAGHRRGRGAPSNASGRFERVQREAFDDGWDLDEETAAIETEVIVERARTIITRNDSPDIGFDRSINPYRGCEHGCSYCFARPSHAFQGLSPGLDFETKIFAKSGAADLLEKELRAPGYEPRTVALGANTDPYQPVERRLRLTRSILEVLARTSHPVGIVTKSALVTRDLDILAPMAARGLVKVAISVTTLDRMLARRMEPRAPTPSRRLDTIRQLGGAGIPVTVLVAPIIPAINDHEIEAILQASRDAGAREAGYVLLRLPHELKEIVRDWLQEHYPDKLRHVLSVLREARGGRDYDAGWTTRQTGVGPYAWMIGRRFDMALDRLHMNRRRLKLRTDLFTPPRPQTGQLSLF
jgi:DNA repair photolyase